jgi:oligoribonuclease NrnB/cAMP/cGMP phosphodiesterase (DHH superfamily)
MNMKCFYHKSDLDGHCSGAIVKMKYPECEMIGVDYDDTLSELFDTTELTIDFGETVFIVDFSFDIDDMDYLAFNCDLHWIDHHKSSIEKLGSFTDPIKGIRYHEKDGDKPSDKKAGCELTWEYLYPDEALPKAVKLLGRYDVWDHTNSEVLPFQYGMRSLESTLPEKTVWTHLFEYGNSIIVEKIVEAGAVLIEYQQKQDEMYAKGMSFEATFEGLRAIAINKAFCNSKVFDSVYDPEKHDVMIAFGLKDGDWKYSLYSTKPEIDVSKLAVKYGGGGHAGASGFYSKEYVL